ncbi:uncharacterized protein LOC126890166 [Diabrotica virgifera virgifera]|uniref:Uncharacterized protein n=1 Tax=Diabrotica virgifera virgifera TaxID=50390 RepID=A0ABM5KXQ4_DIAVI|nr:uncharacterized protein LOC126890166 [Diabrotica virgifera virgifera]
MIDSDTWVLKGASKNKLDTFERLLTMEYINGLLKSFEAEVPAHLKSLLIYNGFDNLYSLSQFNIDEDIERMECYARDVLSKVLKGEEKKAMFGIVSEECSLFKIPEGHKKLLRFVKEESEKKIKLLKRPLLCERSEGCPAEKTFPKKRRTVTNKSTSRSESGNEGDGFCTPNDGCVSQDEEQVNYAMQHVLNISRSYIDKFSRNEFDKGKISEERLQDVLNNSKNLKVKMDGEFTAKISCPLCTFISSAYSVKNSKTGRKWVISNFLRHYKIHFKDDGTNLTKKLPIKPQKPEIQTTILNFIKKDANKKCDLNQDFEDPRGNLFDLTDPNTDLNYGASTSSGLHLELTTELSQNDSFIDQNYEIHDEAQQNNPNGVFLHYNTDLDTDSPTDNESSSQLRTIVVNDFSTEEHQGASQVVNDIPVSELEYNPDNSSPLEDFFFLDNVAEINQSNNGSEKVKSPKAKSLFDDSNSRRERSLRILNELPYHQTQITTFLNTINHAIDTNPEVTNTLSILTENQGINKFNYGTKGLLKYLLDSAIRNSKNKSGHTNKFDDGMKRFWLYIFISAGRMSYEILHSNLKNILPSVTTIHRQLEEMNNILEGEVRIEDLKLYLQKRNYPPIIFISEDQTALIKKVQYDSASNQMVGFVAPLQEQTRFPRINKFPVDSVSDIENAFKNKTLAINAYIFMAQPLVDGSPAFCISIFGSDNRFTSEDVYKRWQYLIKEAGKHGITILGFSSDGDTRCLKSMKIISKLSFTSLNPYSPYFQANYNLENPAVFQDTIHISTKLKTRLLNENISMNMGGKRVSIDNIRYIIENYPRDKHLLCKSFLESSDKMNFNAIDKLSSEHVTNMLKEVPNAEATRQYLILTRNILDAFLLKEISVERRVYLIWYSTFFMRIWKAWLKKNGENIQKNFITTNAYTCIEINAHGIILVIEKLRQNGISEAFLPWLYSSQPCEKVFRETRSMSSTFSTMINYTLLDVLRRLKRIQAMHEISTDLGPNFRFPRQENKRLGNNSSVFKVTEFPSTDEMINIIKKAQEDALSDAKKIGMEMNRDCCIEINLPTCDNPEEQEEVQGSIIITDTISKEHEPDLEPDFSNEDREFLEYTSTFNNYDSLHLRDYTGQKKAQKSCLSVTLKDKKTRIIKKSTLIWFFQEKQGRLSTDRLLRVKGMTVKNTHKGLSKKKTVQEKARPRTSTSRQYQKKKNVSSTS